MPDPLEDLPRLAAELAPAVHAAGREILAVAGRAAAREKADGSPVTIADERAEAVLLPALAALTPEVPVVSEEEASAGRFPVVGERFWLVDPLDGTKEFLRGTGEYTVNVGLVVAGRPVLGLVLAPALGRLFTGVDGAGATVEDDAGRRAIAVRPGPAEGLTVISSRSHGDPAALARFLGGRPVAASLTAGSSLKFCAVAEGRADLYPRLGRTMEWDTAAAQAVVEAAGGRTTDLEGAPLRYGKPGFENPHFIVAGG